MKRTIHMCTWLALASLIGIYGCSGEDDPTPAPNDMADDDAGGEHDGEPDPGAATGIPQGDPCTEDGEACDTGLTCVEGVCCNEPCDGVCRSCRGDISGGFDGECMLLVEGDERVTESGEDCPGPQVCDGQGGCFGRVLGEACIDDSECFSEFCTDGVCCDARCGGSCENCSSGTCEIVENAPDPGTCESQCFEGGVCDGEEVGAFCESPGQCGSELCVGSRCVLADGNPCQDDLECANTCISGTCSPRSIAAGSCEATNDCESSLTCLNGSCRFANGAPCTENSQCMQACVEGVCDSASAPGEVCDGTDTADCEAGLLCLDSICRIPTGDDRGCSADNECQDPICFEGNCAPLRGERERCESDEQCADPNNFVCRPPSGSPGSDSIACRNATGNVCGSTCPGARACGDESFRGSRVCYSTTTSRQVTPWIILAQNGAVVHAVLECTTPTGGTSTSDAIELEGNGTARAVSGSPVSCALGSVVRVACNILASPSEQFRLDSPQPSDERITGDFTGPRDVDRNLPLNGGTTSFIVEQTGAAPCVFEVD